MFKVSIIIPIYNAEKYIKRCVDSILNQTYKNIEILLINDGSKDSSEKIINEYAKKYDFIKVINKKNEGVAKTRNLGITKATGDYIMFLDNDDFVNEKFIESYVDSINDSDIVVGGYKRVSSRKILFNKIIKNTPFGKYENMAPWAKLIKREFLIKNGIEFFSYPIGEDIIFNLNLYSKTNNIKIINNTEYNWFFNDNSVSNTSQKKFDKDILKLCDEMVKFDNNDSAHYYIARYPIWYLLFSGKYETSLNFVNEYEKLNKWLIDNNYKRYLDLKNILKNETSFKNKFIVSTFYIICKLHMLRLFSRIYCKGRE